MASPPFELSAEIPVRNGVDAQSSSLSVSFGNLPDHRYDDIGIRKLAHGYRIAFEASTASERCR